MRKISYLLLCFLFISQVHAQELGKVTFKNAHAFGYSMGVGASEGAVAIDWSHVHGLGKKNQRFKIGYGFRFSSYLGSNQDFTTAPALLTSKEEGPQILFSETYDENIDTLSFSSAQVNTLNIAIHLNYSLTPKLDIGFNIDAIGFSFGGTRTGTFTASPQTYATQQKAKPAAFNLLLVSDNDIGSLNSEIFARYWLSKKWAVKAGAMFLFTEYTTENTLTFDNDRFRNKSFLLILGTSFKPFNK